MFEMSAGIGNIGERNVQMVLKVLAEEHIRVKAKDVGRQLREDDAIERGDGGRQGSYLQSPRDYFAAIAGRNARDRRG